MITLGISGGVDSACCAVLLKQSGQNFRAVFMNNWSETECRADRDRMDALRVCAQLNVPFSVRDFSKEYMENVFQSFLEDYRRGFTPNPDVLCNREVKFKVFLDDCLASGSDQVATGHYARVDRTSKTVKLLRASDRSKDQSYFLHAVPQAALVRAVFPLGEMKKKDVRALKEGQYRNLFYWGAGFPGILASSFKIRSLQILKDVFLQSKRQNQRFIGLTCA